MSPPRFNHMELTLPPGALHEQRADIATFYADLFDWEAIDVPILKQTGLLLRTDADTSQFILLSEQRKHMSSPGYDHLGLLYDTRDAVDRLLEPEGDNTPPVAVRLEPADPAGRDCEPLASS